MTMWDRAWFFGTPKEHLPATKIALCGRREAETGKIAVRKHELGNVGCLAIEELTNIITEERSQ
jgi:hypothetical protein